MYKHIILSTMHFHYFANVNRMNTGIKKLIVHNVQITVKIELYLQNTWIRHSRCGIIYGFLFQVFNTPSCS